MNQTNHFFNLGYGWLCKHCCAEDAERKQRPPASAAAPGFGANAGKEGCSQLALASWADSARHILTCPRCGIEETISTA